MIQRIQSVFLFLAALVGILIYFFPIATFFSDTIYFRFFLCSIRDMSSDPFNEMAVATRQINAWFTMPLAIIQLLIVIVCLITLFAYRKRVLQIRLNTLNIFLNVLLVGGIFYASTLLEAQAGTSPQYGFGGVFPLIGMVLLFLANFNIKKDEKLIRSADRLR